MPTTIVASNSVSYHIWQLSRYTTPSTEDSAEYGIIRNPLTDGFRSAIQTGFDAGVKSWRMTLPTLASYDILPDTLTGPNSESPLSREQYVRAVFAYTKGTGPIVYQDPISGNNYFVRISDGTLDLQRMRVKIFVSGLTLMQMRLTGVTV